MVGWELIIESPEWDLTSKLGIFGDHKTAVSQSSTTKAPVLPVLIKLSSHDPDE